MPVFVVKELLLSIFVVALLATVVVSQELDQTDCPCTRRFQLICRLINQCLLVESVAPSPFPDTMKPTQLPTTMEPTLIPTSKPTVVVSEVPLSQKPSTTPSLAPSVAESAVSSLSVAVEPYYFAYDVPEMTVSPTDMEYEELRSLTAQFYETVFSAQFTEEDEYVFESVQVILLDARFAENIPDSQFEAFVIFDTQVNFQLKDTTAVQIEAVPTPTELYFLIRNSNLVKYIIDYVRQVNAFSSTVSLMLDFTSSLPPPLETVNVEPFYFAYNVPELMESPTDADYEALRTVTAEFLEMVYSTIYTDQTEYKFESLALVLSQALFSANIPDVRFNVFTSYESTVTFSANGETQANAIPTPVQLFSHIRFSSLASYSRDYVQTVDAFSSALFLVLDPTRNLPSFTLAPTLAPAVNGPSISPSLPPTALPTSSPSTDPPTLMPVATPCFFSCQDGLAQGGWAESGLYEVCPNGLDRVTVYCDQQTAGGGWTLLLSYNHTGGTNEELVLGTIPTDPVEGFSHINVNNIEGYSVRNIKAVRFYCQTSGHDRIVHFVTSNATILSIAFDGDQTDNSPDAWSQNPQLLDDHTAFLPVDTDSADQRSDGGFTWFPFYAGGANHWAIRGAFFRWECDDFPNSEAEDTLHLVWARLVPSSTVAMSTHFIAFDVPGLVRSPTTAEYEELRMVTAQYYETVFAGLYTGRSAYEFDSLTLVLSETRYIENIPDDRFEVIVVFETEVTFYATGLAGDVPTTSGLYRNIRGSDLVSYILDYVRSVNLFSLTEAILYDLARNLPASTAAPTFAPTFTPIETVTATVEPFYFAFSVPQLVAPPTNADYEELRSVTADYFETVFAQVYTEQSEFKFVSLTVVLSDARFGADIPDSRFQVFTVFGTNVTFVATNAVQGDALPTPTELYRDIRGSDLQSYILDYVHTVGAFASTNMLFLDFTRELYQGNSVQAPEALIVRVPTAPTTWAPTAVPTPALPTSAILVEAGGGPTRRQL